MFKILQIAPQLIIFSHSHKKEKDYDNDDDDDDDMTCELKGSFEGGGGSKTEWRLKYTFRKK